MTDSVRLAWPNDAHDISAIQRRGWQQKYPKAVWEKLCAELNLEKMTQAWQHAIHSPQLASQRILVASDGTQVFGFAAVGPSPDPDCEESTGAIVEFWIDPMHQRTGHGSRLMNACVDTLKTDGFTSAVWWLTSTDDALRKFAQSAGWETDGAHQELGISDESRIKQIRMYVYFGDPTLAEADN